MQGRCYTYMVECGNGSLYTGVTGNLARRMDEHMRGAGARYIRMHGYKSLAYVEEHPDRGAAMRRECFIKALPRDEKMRMAVSEEDRTMDILRRMGLTDLCCRPYEGVKRAVFSEFSDDGSPVVCGGDIYSPRDFDF